MTSRPRIGKFMHKPLSWRLARLGFSDLAAKAKEMEDKIEALERIQALQAELLRREGQSNARPIS